MGASPEAHAQRDDPLDHRLGYGGGGTSADGWSGRLWAVAGPVPVGPPLDGGPGALKAGSDRRQRASPPRPPGGRPSREHAGSRLR